MERPLILVTGPTRSGKSEWAEELAHQCKKPVTYVATAWVDPSDADWQARIDRHQQRRPPEWTTQHVPIELGETIQAASDQDCLLVDSLGTWIANFLDQDENAWANTEQHLLKSLQQSIAMVILVAEETGWGVVPSYPIGRTFRDRLGNLTRQIGTLCNTVYLVTGGYALEISALGIPVPKR